ncbi:hypothetical protein AJ87_49340 [Rhizobium yanglingense]|nr:hypothetical protein AJ87_49340 [Rhizobium yanglingense]
MIEPATIAIVLRKCDERFAAQVDRANHIEACKRVIGGNNANFVANFKLLHGHAIDGNADLHNTKLIVKCEQLPHQIGIVQGMERDARCPR